MATRSAKEQLGVDLPDGPELPPEPEPVVEEPERPEWLPEKFKDEKEFAESYRNLETELRTRAETQKDLESRLDTLTDLVSGMQPQEYQQQQPVQQGNVQEQLYAAYENDPVGTMLMLANAAADQRFQQYQQAQLPYAAQQQQMQGEMVAATASRALGARYPDWNEYEARVGAVIEQHPELLTEQALSSIDSTVNSLDQVYRMVKYDDLVNQVNEAGSAANGEAMKRQAQTMRGGQSQRTEPSEVDEKIASLKAATRNSSWSAFRGS